MGKVLSHPTKGIKQLQNLKPDTYSRFEKIRDAKGITNYRICRDLNIPECSLSKWKREGCTPKYERLREIANYLSCTVDDFYPELESSEVK